MEMYAADNSRGGVLEANGAASIKYRQKDIIATAHRLDPVLQSIDKKVR
jgi:acetyl-CoA carboxylase / biotin carboxylase 1